MRGSDLISHLVVNYERGPREEWAPNIAVDPWQGTRGGGWPAMFTKGKGTRVGVPDGAPFYVPFNELYQVLESSGTPGCRTARPAPGSFSKFRYRRGIKLN